jgi:hypothetical protein
MKILLDTHAFLWFIAGDIRLSDKAKTSIEDDKQREDCQYGKHVGNGNQDQHWEAKSIRAV